MCRPTDNDNNNNGLRHVIISGAGPAGLLLAALLHQRNEELPSPLYKVTVIDNREDMGVLSLEELKKRFRSWMLGLAGHGIEAIKQVDNGQLYKDYCQQVGMQLDSLSIHLGAKEIVQGTVDDIKDTDTNPDKPIPEAFIVDRNFIVAALARYVNAIKDNQSQSQSELTTLYEHKVLYVDYDNQRVLVRNLITETESYMSYDLLVGCDGARSVVREAMVKRHSTFEVEVGDIFQTFKATHVQRPPNVKSSSMHILPDCFPNMQGVALPETGDMLNISIGIPRHLIDTPACPPELKSNDPKVVANYVKENFKAFPLMDYDDFAQQWVQQRWNRTAQVHCNFYHSNEIHVVLMGDAAHATSPSIGMGMNTALRDAQHFYLLLQQHKDDFTQVLPAFSKQRVKEGNSLSDLAMHLYCMNTKHQLLETLHMVIRTKLHQWFPTLVEQHPQAMIGLPEYNLSDVYDAAMRLGIIPKHRAINNKIRQDYFERETGMVSTPERNSRMPSIKTMLAFSGLVAVGAMVLKSWR